MGRADHQRQPDAAGRILSRLKDIADVEWIGGGTDYGIELLESHGVPATGWLAKAKALERLAGATAYLHWSAWDGRSLAILEAMAYDLVVVASNIPANSEVLGPEQICDNEDQAVELLRSIVTDPTVRERLLEDQRARRDGYSALQMANEWEAVYLRLVPRSETLIPALRDASPDVSSAP